MAAIRLCDIVHNRNVLRQTAVFLGEVQSLLCAAAVEGFQYSDFSFRYWLVAATAYHSVLDGLGEVDEILYSRICSLLSVLESFLAYWPFEHKDAEELLRTMNVLAIDCVFRIEQQINSMRSALFLDEDR